jgi:hypothetical protein
MATDTPTGGGGRALTDAAAKGSPERPEISPASPLDTPRAAPGEDQQDTLGGPLGSGTPHGQTIREVVEREREQRERAYGTPRTRGLKEQARDGVLRQLDSQKERAASGLSALVGALRQSGRELVSQNATVAPYVDSAANQIERVVEGLRAKDLRGMVTDLERFARQRPGVFVGGAFLIGLAAARFLKSSSDSDEPWRRSSAAPVRAGGLGRGYGTEEVGGGYGQGG